MGITDSYSGVVINQNAIATGEFFWRNVYNGNWIYQTFNLPPGYQRGSTIAEQRIPDLAGFQVLVDIDATYAMSASLDYVLQYYGGSGWVTLSSDTVIGAQADGSRVWFDVIFSDPVPIPVTLLAQEFRFGIQTRTAYSQALGEPVTVGADGGYIINGQGYTANLIEGVPSPIAVTGVPAFLLLADTQVTYSVQQGIGGLWYVSPSPILGRAFQADEVTPLLGLGTSACLNFRILGLAADNGIDFLNNEYRSVVIQSSPGNTDTTGGLTPISGSGQGNYWMSPPQPSRFAVQSLYFDVRPVSRTAQFGTLNLVGNPSFEYDKIGHAPAWWLPLNNGGTVVDQTVSQNWAYDKQQSLHMQYTFTAPGQQQGVTSPQIPISPTTGGRIVTVSASAQYDVVIDSSATLYFGLTWYDNNHNILNTAVDAVAAAPQRNGTSFSLDVYANAAYMTFQVYVQSTGAGSFEGFIDAAQLTLTASAQPYFDGDDPNVAWTAQRGRSPSAQIIEPAVDDNFVVLDGVLVDPITPNMAFNVYYSEDDAYTNTNMTESDWEQKLWSRVPEAYICTQRQQYAFPEPIHAKYMKIEFTNLPAQSYDPGPFQKPVSYKKFPTWVANFFLNQLTPPSFIASQVNVQYNALSFAYSYYLDDLDQSPAMPTAPPEEMAQQLTSYFATNSNTTVDPTTLSQINLAMKPYQSPLGSQIDESTLLSSYARQLSNPVGNPAATSEGGIPPAIDYSTVSSLSREPVILEQSLPVMYFFLTSRHAYKELKAEFEYNRAYFAGVNDVAFLRNNYTVAADTSLYIESGGDPANIEFSDWVLDTDKNWYTYGG